MLRRLARWFRLRKATRTLLANTKKTDGGVPFNP